VFLAHHTQMDGPKENDVPKHRDKRSRIDPSETFGEKESISSISTRTAIRNRRLQVKQQREGSPAESKTPPPSTNANSDTTTTNNNNNVNTVSNQNHNSTPLNATTSSNIRRNYQNSGTSEDKQQDSKTAPFLITALEELRRLEEEERSKQNIEILEREKAHLQRGIVTRDRVIQKLKRELDEKDRILRSLPRELVANWVVTERMIARAQRNFVGANSLL